MNPDAKELGVRRGMKGAIPDPGQVAMSASCGYPFGEEWGIAYLDRETG